MYELEYVRKRKRKKRVAIIAGISTTVITALCIVAFLGRYVGTFTVSLDNGKVTLALSRTKSFESSTSFLRVDDLPTFQEFTYQSFESPSRGRSHAAIDSELSDIDIGVAAYKDDGSIRSLDFFKYTFYVKNVGDTPAQYDFSINILESNPATDGRYLDDDLRVMLYDNKEDDEHEKTVYAKRSREPHYDEHGELDYRAPISISEYEATEDNPFQGYAEMFSSTTLIMKRKVSGFEVGEVRRYTVAFWLEGYSSDSNKPAPEGATIKLGVEINAYEIN